MTWVRYDDNVANHLKVAPLDDATYRLWREAIEWSAHNLTDGGIRVHQLLLTSTRASKSRAEKLVKAGLWHTAGTPCDSPMCPPSSGDGWVIHDYWDYQPTREKVRAGQTAKAERQRRWLEGRKGGGKDAPGDASGVAPKDASQKASSDASLDAAPAPPRPAPKGRVGTDVPTAADARRAAAVPAGGGREEDRSVAHPSTDLGPEDPEALAREQDEIRADAEAKVRAAADLQRRSANGAAAARAAIAGAKPPRTERTNGLAALREATPGVAIQLTEPEPQES